MTTVSIAAGFLTALFGGLLLGRFLRNVRSGNTMAFALALTAGLLVLQTSRASDVLRVVQPRVASDWLSVFTILAASCMLIRPAGYRVGCGVILALSIPIRLLWASIYLPSESFDFIIWLCITTWSAALALSVLLKTEKTIQRISGETVAWGIALAGTTSAIIMSGSLTYGAMTGICGVAALSVLISTSQIPNIAAVPVVCLIGLSAAFSELSVSTAGLLLLSWIGLLLADRITNLRGAGKLRAVAVFVLILTVSATFARLTGVPGEAAPSNSGYGDFDSDLSVGTRSESGAGQSTNESDRGASPKKSDSTGMKLGGSDPFEGLELD